MISFSLLRAWHDRRAADALWRRFNLLLGYSTDPRQAIQNLDQSPFNVGIKIQFLAIFRMLRRGN